MASNMSEIGGVWQKLVESCEMIRVMHKRIESIKCIDTFKQLVV